MKNKKKLIPVVILLFIISLFIDYPVFESNVIGVYVEKYTSNDRYMKFRKRERDTLYLKKGGLLFSKFWGNGTYKLKNYNEIILTPEKGKSITTHTTVTNELFSKFKIIINHSADWEYYEKIN